MKTTDNERSTMSRYDEMYNEELAGQLKELADQWKRAADTAVAEFKTRMAKNGIAETIRWNAEDAIGAEYLGELAEYIHEVLLGHPPVEVLAEVLNQLKARADEAITISSTGLFWNAQVLAIGRAALRSRSKLSYMPSYAKDRTRNRIAGQVRLDALSSAYRLHKAAVGKMDRARSAESKEQRQLEVADRQRLIEEYQAEIDQAVAAAKSEHTPVSA